MLFMPPEVLYYFLQSLDERTGSLAIHFSILLQVKLFRSWSHKTTAKELLSFWFLLADEKA